MMGSDQDEQGDAPAGQDDDFSRRWVDGGSFFFFWLLALTGEHAAIPGDAERYVFNFALWDAHACNSENPKTGCREEQSRSQRTDGPWSTSLRQRRF